MIAKVAKVQALREAFPVQLGAMYTSEEQGISENRGREVTDAVIIEQSEPTDIVAQEEPTAPAPAPSESPKQVDFKTL